MASVVQENPGTSPTSARLKLYSYWRSSCAWRVRIALNLKGLPYEYKAVNLMQGEQFTEEFTKLNPLQLVPTLVDGDIIVSDSFAILLYLEDKYPEHPLIPDDLQLKAISLQADVFLVPQVFNGAGRFNVDMSKFPTLDRINQALQELPEFQAALPERTPDAKA